MSWLVLVLGLVAALAVAATALKPAVGDLVERVGEGAGVEVTAGDEGGPGDVSEEDFSLPGSPGTATSEGPSANGGPDDQPADEPSAQLPEVEPGDESDLPALEDWDIEDFSDALHEALEDGDFERFDELKATFLEGIDGLDAEATEALLDELAQFDGEYRGDETLLLLLATSENGTSNPAVAARLGLLGEEDFLLLNYSLSEREYLAQYLDLDAAESVPDQIARKVYEDAAANGSLVEMVLAGGQHAEVSPILAEVLAAHVQEHPESLVAAAESGVLLDVINNNGEQPEVREILSEALYERLLEHPELLEAAAHAARRDGKSIKLQDLLEAVGHANSDAELEALVTAAIVTGAAGLHDVLQDAPSESAQGLQHPAVLEFAADIGQLLHQIDEIGSAGSFDPTGLAFLALKEIPVAGDGFKIAEKLFGGYIADPTYTNLVGEDLETANLQLAALAIAAAADPSVVPQLDIVVANLQAGMELVDAWAHNPQLASEVSQIQTTIENGKNATAVN